MTRLPVFSIPDRVTSAISSVLTLQFATRDMRISDAQRRLAVMGRNCRQQLLCSRLVPAAVKLLPGSPKVPTASTDCPALESAGGMTDDTGSLHPDYQLHFFCRSLKSY
jgi:hypothetical protein